MIIEETAQMTKRDWHRILDKKFFWNWDYHGAVVIRLKYTNGEFSEASYQIANANNQTRRLTFVKPCPPEAIYHGLKFDRIHQFHFDRPGEAFMYITNTTNREWADKFFRTRVERLRRKGLLEETPKISPNHTSCRDCVFATYEGKTQVGCSFGSRTALYAERGRLVEAYDETKEFFVVNNTRCVAHRTKAWADKQGGVTLADAARAELQQKVDFLIPLHDPVNWDDISLTLNSLRRSSVPPNSVTLINLQKQFRVPELHARLRQVADGLNWFLSDPREDYITDGRAVDLAVTKLKGHFYSVWHPGVMVPREFVRNLDAKVVDQIGRALLLTPDNMGNGLTVALGFHRSVEGNQTVRAGLFNERGADDDRLLNSVAEKAVYLATEVGLDWLVEPMEDYV